MEEKKLNWDKVGYHFDDSYKEVLSPFIESEEFYVIMNTLTEEAKSGKKVLPGKTEMFRIFRETKLQDIKVIFLGLSPYPQVNLGDGLAFSCSKTMIEQPSLKILLDACEDNLDLKGERNPDLQRWSSQGVFLLNLALSCRTSEPLSHVNLWKPFTKFLFTSVFNTLNVPIIYFGAEARNFMQYDNKDLHKSLAVEHPARAARLERGLDHKGLFTFCNNFLKKQGKSEISWLEFKDLPFDMPEKKQYEEF